MVSYKTMNKRLIACPFCGSNKVELCLCMEEHEKFEDSSPGAICVECCVSTGAKASNRLAIASWNNRVFGDGVPCVQGYKACPFCGSKFVQLFECEFMDSLVYIKCACGARTESGIELEVVAVWNRRVTQLTKQ